jgi:hypothetical protein
MRFDLSKFLSILSLWILIGTISFAQSIAPQSVNTAGAKMTQSNGSLSFTVGELVVLQQYDANGNSLGGGFTNAATVSTAILAVEEPSSEILQVDVFPNPTSDLVQIRIKESKLENLKISMTDISGKEIFQGSYRLMQQIIGINTATYPSGTYFLTLKDFQGNVLGTYKVVKQ